MSTTMIAALKVSAFGIGGVFATLILFYLVTRLMIVIARKLPDSQE